MVELGRAVGAARRGSSTPDAGDVHRQDGDENNKDGCCIGALQAPVPTSLARRTSLGARHRLRHDATNTTRRSRGVSLRTTAQ